MRDLSLTYGEINPGQLNRLLSKNNNIKTFIDLGSGNGQLCYEACSIPHLTSVVGLELLPSRIAQALTLKKQHKTLMQHCKFYLHDLKKPFIGLTQPSLAYVCSTCFEPDLIEKISSWVTDDLLIKSIISLKPLPLNAASWKISTIGMILCSWDVSNYYQYERLEKLILKTSTNLLEGKK
jgi:hypothetical protein